MEENHLDTKWSNQQVKSQINSKINNVSQVAPINFDLGVNHNESEAIATKYENPFKVGKSETTAPLPTEQIIIYVPE